MQHYEIKEVFNRFFKSKNIMTPYVLDYGKKNNHIFEISKGKGIDHKTIYGVTVLEINGGDESGAYTKTINSTNYYHDTDLSCLCHSMDEVNNYVSTL